MGRLVTTPHDFIWRIKNPEEYWANLITEVKYMVSINHKVRGKFIGVNRSFDDDMYYVNFYDEADKLDYMSVDSQTEMILEPIMKGE